MAVIFGPVPLVVGAGVVVCAIAHAAKSSTAVRTAEAMFLVVWKFSEPGG
jgi:hypothetical protein